MTAATLTNQPPALASPFDSGGVNSVVPSASQMSNGFIPNIDNIAAEQQNYLHRASTTALWLNQQLGLALPFNPIAGASVVATPKGGVVSLKDSVTGNTQFYVALNAMPVGYTDPSLDPANWGYLDLGAISKYITPYSDAGGTPDAITANYPNMIYPALQDGTNLRIDVVTSNTTTTPTFQPTLNGNVQTPRVIVKKVNNTVVPLAVGDLQGICELSYSPTALAWVLVNPPVTTASCKLPEITATVAANALTIGATPQYMSFRSSTIGSGAISTIYAAPATIIIPAGATLGTINGIASSLIVAEMNFNGVAEFAVCNLSGGLQMDEINLLTTTAISAASSSANVWYSTTARTNMPYKIVARLDSTQATAGQWATAMSLIQGAGGNALTAMNSLGFGQTWQAPARSVGVTYYTGSKPRQVAIYMQQTNGGGAEFRINGVNFQTLAGTVSGNPNFVFHVLPPNTAYGVFPIANPLTLVSWAELF